MEITNVKIHPAEGSDGRLLAYASFVIDDWFVVHELKIINGDRGPFVAMPTRKIADHCPGCNGKNPLLAHYCNRCGRELADHRGEVDPKTGRVKLYADVAHPINQTCRELIQQAVLAAYDAQQAEAEMHAGSEAG